MKTTDAHLALLPSGFADMLPPHAAQEAAAIAALMAVFDSLGYQRIKPPLAEFEDSLLARGPGAALAGETFRLMDPVSHRMMGIRSDITPQIARMARSRLEKEARPLRLAYANDVLRTRASQERTRRQFCQVGCELIGAEDVQADIEICAMALQGLAALEIGPVTLDLAVPRLVDALFDEAGLEAEARAALREALAKKDAEAVRRLDGPALLAGLAAFTGDAPAVLQKLEKASLPEAAQTDIRTLRAVYDGVQGAMAELNLDHAALTIDLLEQKGFDYHEGVAFTLFSPAVHGELGRGGRYRVGFGGEGEGETATGFTFYMDTIDKILPAPAKANRVFVPAGEDWSVIAGLQAEGRAVLRGVSKGEKPSKDCCTHIYCNGKIEKL